MLHFQEKTNLLFKLYKNKISRYQSNSKLKMSQFCRASWEFDKEASLQVYRFLFSGGKKIYLVLKQLLKYLISYFMHI